MRIALEDIKARAKGKEDNYLEAVAFSMLFKSVHTSSILLNSSVSVRKNRKALLSRLGVGETKFCRCLNLCRMYGLLVPVGDDRELFVKLYKKRERISKIRLVRNDGKKMTVNYIVNLLRAGIALDYIRFNQMLRDSEKFMNSDTAHSKLGAIRAARAEKILNRFANGRVDETISLKAFSKRIGASRYKTRKALNHLLDSGFVTKEAVFLDPITIQKHNGFKEIMSATEDEMERDYLRGKIIIGEHGKKAYGVRKNGYVVYQTSNKWSLTTLGKKHGKFITTTLGKKQGKKTILDCGKSYEDRMILSGDKFGMFN